jgi:hypothetical protein
MVEYTFRLGPLWGWLDPMDILEIPDPTNLTSTIIVRVISAQDDEKDNVTIVAEEFPVGAQSPVVITAPPTTPPNQGASNIAAAPVFTPVIFEPTALMLTATGKATPQYVIGASGGYNGLLDSFWGGYKVWLSLDDASYELQPGLQQGPSGVGTLSAPLTGLGNIVVNLSESNWALASTTSSLAAMGKNLVCLQDASGIELVSYTTATLSGPNIWTLTGVFRGLYGTTSRDFGTGTRFLYVDTTGNFFEADVPPQYIGSTFWVKLQSFNVFNNHLQDLSSCVPYQFLVTGTTPVPPVPPASMAQSTYRRRRQQPTPETKAGAYPRRKHL